LNELPDQSQNGSADADANATTSAAGESNTAPNKSTSPTDLMREVERFSTRAIEQLAIIKDANTIVSLSNYHVSFHDLKTYELIETLNRTKNATCFASTSNIVKDPDTGVPEIVSRLAVAVKRKLLLWSWLESELSEDVDEIVLAESIRSVTWASATKLVCGLNGGYVMVNVVTREVEDIVSPGSGPAAGQTSRFGAMSSAGMGYMGLGGYMPKPLSTKLAEGEILLAKDINTLFIDDDGKPLDIPTFSPCKRLQKAHLKFEILQHSHRYKTYRYLERLSYTFHHQPTALHTAAKVFISRANDVFGRWMRQTMTLKSRSLWMVVILMKQLAYWKC